MEPFSPTLLSIGTVVATYISLRGTKRKSLSKSGACTAFAVAFLSIACGLRGFVLLMFYQIGTKATKYKKQIKLQRDGDVAKSSVRGPSQVLACSVLAVALSLVHAIYFGEERKIDFQEHKYESMLACAILSHHATCLADTLASELGILSKKAPFLITTFRKVPAGCNGGVTMNGFFFSFVGGFLMGLGQLIMDIISGLEVQPLKVLLFGSVSGLVGSILDSFLGATVQATYYDKEKKLIYCDKEDAPKDVEQICGYNILSNAQVNAVSVACTCTFGGIVLGPMIFKEE
ncbi:hypothetical protein CTEN210_17510 [Chaetoceros tenuissimus]|uniref:Transmembrane protein 19 n=1 Tax=Chaetoceros tenuissimus TaxID=426638 RepID=A0AAD3DE74_9STRA|nr:hypothetical protein CTEN210_17510 [Chaetoceros tenuissimus]